MTQVVGPNGEVLIEPELREQLGVQPGSVAVQRVVNNHLEIEFVAPSSPDNGAPLTRAPQSGRRQGPPVEALSTSREPVQTHSRSLRGVLAPYVTRRPSPNEDWQTLKERAWQHAVMEEVDRWRTSESFPEPPRQDG